MKIPLAEHFHSLQGEGTYVGTPMHFIRLPGCSVGKYLGPHSLPLPNTFTPVLPSGRPAWECTTFNGTKFWCDTDFNKYEEVELNDLLHETWEDHICLTGGEPLIHRNVINAFRRACANNFDNNISQGRFLHIETSGTIDFWWEAENFGYEKDTWVTVSPKQGWTPYMIHHANELKLLVSGSTKDEFDPAFLSHPNVYLSPINDVGTNFGWEGIESLKRCQELLRAHPSWKLSIQVHKYLGLK